MLDEPHAVDVISMPAVSGGLASPECAILDEGEHCIAAAHYARIVRAIVADEYAAIESGRNSRCFRACFDASAGFRTDSGSSAGAGVRADSDMCGDAGGASPPIECVAVKVPHLGPQRTNADTTFAHEAAILARLPEVGIANAPRLLARVAANGGHFLFTTWLAGTHPDPVAQPLAARHLAIILASCAAMDRQGLMHYDLKATNVLIEGDAVRFVDFEFARFDGILDAFAPARAAYCDDYNVSGNPHFPARSNVANFEFRALYRYCEDLAASSSAVASRGFFRRYLQLRAQHHEAMATFYADLERVSARILATRGGLDVRESALRLRNAADHERLVARLLRDPAAEVVEMEWSILGLRHDMFERPGADVMRRCGDLRDRIRRDFMTSEVMPATYLKAVAWTAECIGRSRRIAEGSPIR